MAGRSVSNKAVVKDSAFLSKLGSTMARRGHNPMEQGPVRSSITWKKTSNVKYRLKTLTGTIPIYEDMTEEQVEDVKRKHGLLPGTFPDCIPPPPPGEEGELSPSQMEEPDYEVMEAKSTTFMSTSSTKVQKRSSTTSITQIQQETSSSSHQQKEEYMESYSSQSRTRKKVSSSSKATEHLASTSKDARVSYVATEEYTPDDYDGLPLTSGQKVFLLSKGSSHKKARIEGSEDLFLGEAPPMQLLDNSLAKAKAAIRPKKNHPDSRSRPGSALQASPEPPQQQAAQDTSSSGEERWFVQDFDTGREGYVPARALEVSKQAAVVSSIKSSVANLSAEEGNAMKLQMLAQIREFRSKRPQRTLGPTPDDEARAKRTATIQELIETEEEFVRDLKFAMAKYYRLMEDPNTPYHIREHKDIIFNNFKHIADFHENVLIEGVKYNAEVPLLIGKTFLRLERDFDKHAEYCSNEPLAQDFVDNNPIIRDYFDDYSNKIGDEKRLSEHLKLPIQRLNDYQLLLRELVKFSHKLGDNTEDLQRAFELMQTIPQRATDAKFISSIEGFKGNLFKLGRLVRHDWFSVSESGGKPRDRYLFLFKARVLITKVKRISEDRSIFVLKDIIRLPETNITEVDNSCAISFEHIEPQTHLNFPLVIEARNGDIREAWYDGIKEFVVDTASVEDLLFDDELRVVSADVDEDNPHAIASPVPEIKEYEDLPEDTPQRSPAKVSPKAGREPSPPAKRVKADQQQSQRDTGTPVQVEVEIDAESVVDAPIGKTPTPQCPTPKDKAHDRLKTEDSNTRKISTCSSGSGTEAAFERIATDAQAELDEQAKREEEARLATEVREKKEAEFRVKAEAEAEACRQKIALEARKAREEEEKRAREEVEKKAKEEQERHSLEQAEKKQREEAERYAREESERIAREETERKSREETERKVREEEEIRKREETERKSRLEAERLAREEEDRRARAEADRIAREAEERRVREETEIREREEADRNSREEEKRVREEAERKSREESQRKAREEEERIAREEKERITREVEEKRVKEEKERREREESERRAIEEAQKQTREEEERRVREEAEKRSREESERQAREVEERRAREEKEKIAREGEEKRVKEEKERKEREESERRAREEADTKSREESERQAKEVEERRAREEKEKIVREAEEKRVREEKEKKEREEAERKAREEAQIKKREEGERIAREEAEKKAKEEVVRKTKEEEERRAREEVEKRNRAEADRKSREEAERKAREEAERIAREEEERKTREEADRKAKDEAGRKAKEETEKKAREEAERKAREEAEVIAREGAEKKSREEADRKAKEEAERKARVEKERKAREEAEIKAREEAEIKSKKEAEENRKIEENRIAKEGENKKLKEEEVRKAKEEEVKRLKEEETRKTKEKAEAAAKTKSEAEAKAKADAKSKADAEAKRLKEEQAAKTKAESEAKAKAEAEVKRQKEEQEAKARKEAETKARTNAASASQKQAVSQQKPASPKVVVPAQQKSNMSEPQTPETGYGLQKTPATASGAPRPIFTTQLKGECVEPGEGVKFVCEIGHPVPYFVTWLKDSKPLDDKLADRVQQTDDGISHSLKILNCRKQDSGTYTAKAADEVGGAATSSAQLLVQELSEEERAARIAEKTPFFMVKMKDTHVIENTNLSYCVNVRGNPPPEVTFYKDGDELKEDSRIAVVRNKDQGHYELVFAYVTQSDGGSYKAVAKNNFGKVECDANMVVTEEEVAYQKLAGKGSLMKEGEKADFKWFRDGQEYDPLERFNVMFRDEEDTLALVFQNVTPEDAGLYTCVASTSGGKISCSAELTVEGAVNRLLRDPEPPCIIEELQDVMVAINGSAMLECKVTGFPKPELVWTRNCLPVKIGGRFKQICEDDDTVTLIIKNIEEYDGGSYRIMAVNELGDAESTCSLKIKSAPKIKKMKKDAACKLGINLEHTAEITGEPKPNLKWLKDGKNLYETDRVKGVWLEDNLYCLSIEDMEKDDCATYTLVAENDMGVVQESFELEVDSPPELQRGLEAEMDRKAGGDFTLEVRCKGSPRPMARWFFNGKELDSDGDKYVMKRDETFYQLKIKGLDRKDKGTFKVVLCNSSGEVESEGKLNVRAPPDFTTPLRDASCKEGTQNTKLFAQVVSVPAATFKWFFGDKEIKMGEETPGYSLKSTDESSTLLCVKEALPEFCGVYTCKASNEVGESKTSCKFRLYEAPVITEPLQDLEMLEDMNYKWAFRCTGVPVPDIKWTKDGKKFSPDERRVKAQKDGDEIYRLEIMEAKVEDTAEYVATLTNAVATVTTSAKLATNTPPHVKGCNFAEGKSFYAGHKFLLSIECHSEPICDATWWWGGKELNEQEDNCKMWYDAEKKTFFLERYQTDTDHTGMYKVMLKNKIGQHEQQANIRVTEKEARVRVALEDCCVHENGTAVMKCQIVGDPICDVTWLKDGKKLPETARIQTEEDRVNGWHTIIIKEVTERDNCLFTCKGVNKHGQCKTEARLGVLVAPQPTELKDAKVDYGKDLTICVSIHAFPVPEMKWFLEGNELPKDQPEKYSYNYEDGVKELHSITIHNCVLEDAGYYKFVASNDAGQASKKQETKVHTEKPSVVIGLKEDKICLEDEVTMKIQLAGLPLPDVTWLNKEKPVSSNPRYIIERPDNADFFQLTIKDVCLEDYGHITAVGKNLVGECHTVCEMGQKKLPCTFVQALENVTKGAEGDDVTLTVKIKASPRPTFQWFKDGDVLEENEKVVFSMTKTTYCEATITVTLVEASSLESGQYKLKITNEVNDASTETALICRPVRRAPKITKKPQNASCQENEKAMFKCKINGFPKPDVKWMKDGRPLSFTETTDSGMTADGFYYFEFKSVTTEDAGHYTVIASNDEGKTSAECNLEVIPPPSKPDFLMGLKPGKVIQGYPGRFEVKCGGYPPPTITWMKDGQPLEIDGKHIRQVVLDDGTVQLLIDNCTEADQGKYTCMAQSSEGQIESTADLSVLGFQRKDGQPDGPAKFSEGLRDCCFDEGKTIKLPVAMKGGPVPIMKWYKDGEEIVLGDGVFFTYDGDRAFLEITPAKGSDSGIYKCVIQNDKGKDETECEVTIRKCYEAPSFGSCFGNVCQLPGREAKFPVHFDGVPKPEFTWYKDGKPIIIDGEKYRVKKDGDCYTLIVADCTYGDSGVYKVVLKNREGEIEHEGNLEVGDNVDPNRKSEAPNFLKTIGDQELYEGYIAKFKAVVVGSPFPDFEFSKDGARVYSTNRIVVERDHDGEGLIRLTIKQVRPEDAGQYTLRCWNEHGEKSCSGKLICESLTSKKKRPVGDEYEGFPKIRRSGVPMPLPDKPYISALSDRRVTLSWMPYLPQGPTMPVTYQIEMCEAPEGEYFTVRSGIRGCKCDILNLNPKLDYRFRIRVENKFGVSEASPFVQTYRYKLDQEPTSYEPKLDPNYVYKGEGPYVPEGFRIERTHEGNYFAAPRFLKLPHETQYGIKGFNSRVKWYAFGWPTPKLQFLFNEEPLKTGAGTRFTVSQEASGEIILFVDKMQASDIGWYSCIVKNEHGQSCQRIKLQMAEFPKVTENLEEMYLRTNTNGKLMCRIQASPLCEVTWFKDWEPLTPSYRFRPQFCADDMYILHINGASLRDTGFYSVAATNAAGTVMSSCYVHVEEEDLSFNWAATGRGKQVIVNQRRGTLEDTYDVGDELGRGTQGVTYHCVERYTGRNFAAKSMWGRDKLKVWMHMEFEMMNLVNNSQYICRLFDAYEGPKNMVLVQELCSGGDLLYHLTQQQFITEYEVAHYIRQVLLGLEYMHDRCLAHCGLNVGDILLTRPNGTDIKLCDLSLSRHIRSGKLQPLDYGMPEFVAPEVANGENISYGVDMWAVGIISYLLLSGTSPFRGEHDRETLSRIQKGDMSFDMEAFTHISNEAKDFIARLLKFEPDLRLDVKGALMHPWIAFSQMAVPKDAYKINTDRLRTYYVKYRDWYANASCKRWFRRRTLSSAFTHPSKMVYPPGEVYTPPDSPEREILPVKDDSWLFEERDLSYQIDVITNDSQYQSGPDTFLMQLRDVDFPVRLRQYMKVAEERSPAFNMYMRENQYDYSRVPMVHERRRFIDVMDEELAVVERRRTMLDKYTAGFVRTQMTQETCSLDMPRVANQPGNQLAIGDVPAGTGTVPFIREKPQSVSVASGEPIAFTCIASGEPQPTIQWFKDDMILGVTTRCTISTKEDGRSTLTIERPNEFDTGLYKVIARNPSGQSSHKFRVMSGDIPGPCEPPEVNEVSATECLVRWRPPRDIGNSPIVHYHLQIKPAGETEYVTFRDNIDHEFYLVKDLAPNSIYQFKVAAKNAFGWGQFSVATAAIRTGQQGASQIELSHAMQFQMELTESGINDKMKKLNAKSSRELDYNKEKEPIKMKTGDAAELQLSKYSFVSEMSRGRFSVVAKCVRRDDQRQFAAKIMQRTGREEAVKQEYEVLKALRHERIAQLCEAYTLGNVTILLQEQLSGHDILTYLSNLYEYSEQTIVTVLLQLIDALQYLHWRGYCHLDLQPDNIVVVSPRNCHIKLVDLGSTREVPQSGATVPVNGLLEYIAPEILSEQKAYPVSDVWSLGTLTYTLLTGRSAFKGDDVEETNENIQYVRYRCDYLHCSQEAVRFVMLILKRDPSKRPTLEDLREHRWMLENEFMAKKRERAMLSGTRLRDHDEKYHRERMANGTTLKELLSFGGLNLPKKAKYEQMLYTQIF